MKDIVCLHLGMFIMDNLQSLILAFSLLPGLCEGHCLSASRYVCNEQPSELDIGIFSGYQACVKDIVCLHLGMFTMNNLLSLILAFSLVTRPV